MIYTKGKVTYYMEKSNIPDFETATGTIDYGFTNDSVFRIGEEPAGEQRWAESLDLFHPAHGAGWN